VAIVIGLLAGPPSASAETRPIQVGFYDTVFESADPLERAAWLDRARDIGSGVVRLNLWWPQVATTRPANPTDPADPAYRWAAVDASVADATARGLRVLHSIETTPTWAEQGERPASARAGSWQPDPAALGAFAGAAARRYAGVVRAWQIWNEPNLSFYLAPQWRNGRMFAPTRYRAMLNAAYSAIKAVDPANLVVTAGTGPYGDPLPGGQRIMPARFWRAVLCLTGTRLKPLSCPAPASFDVIAHHPYGVRGPTSHALNADDVAVPDLGKLTRIVRAAVHERTVLPARPKPLWVTEISWDSRPPDPDGVAAEQQADWLADSLAVLWRQGVELVTWFRIRDQAPVPSYGATNQSGVYFLGGDAKPSLDAWLFPLSCRRSGTRQVVWGRAPGAGPVSVERRAGSTWRTVATVDATASRVFQLRLATRGTVRARAGAVTSRSCQ
jgi:hypothetical protein